jgi:hypothetical protein
VLSDFQSICIQTLDLLLMNFLPESLELRLLPGIPECNLFAMGTFIALALPRLVVSFVSVV